MGCDWSRKRILLTLLGGVAIITLIVVLCVVLIPRSSDGKNNIDDSNDPDPEPSRSGCEDFTCEYLQTDFGKVDGADTLTYTATSDNCHGPTQLFEMELATSDDVLSLKTSLTGDPVQQTADYELANTKQTIIMNGVTESTRITMYWLMDKTSRTNETLTFVFEDDGTEYMGLGGFKDSVLRTKGSMETYTLWSTEDDPYYFPFYLTRNSHGAICMCADAGGAPFKVIVSSDKTTWTGYTDQMDFYFFGGDTAVEAINGCLEKWTELYSFTETEWAWNMNIITGSTTTTDIVAARDDDLSIVSFYVISGDEVEIDSESSTFTVTGTLEDMSDIYLTWNSRVKVNSDQTTVMSGVHDAGSSKYYLDCTEQDVESWVTPMINSVSETYKGVFLGEGFLPGQIITGGDEASTDTCEPEYLYCSSLSYDKTSTPCSGTEFGLDRVMLTAHNLYDRVRTEFILSIVPNMKVYQSSASPGLTNFYRENVAASWEGLQECMNELVNMQLAGVYGYTCNLCGGELPDDPNDVLCLRWSHISILMPSVIMTSATTLPVIDGYTGADYLDALQSERITLHLYMEDELAKAEDAKRAFIYPYVLEAIEEYSDHTAVMIGGILFFSPVLRDITGEGSISIRSPDSAESWFQLSSGRNYPGGESIDVDDSTDVESLMFIKDGSVLLKNIFGGNRVEVHIYPLVMDDYTVSHTVTVHSGDETLQATISIPGAGDRVKFRRTDAGAGTTPIINYKVDKMVIYSWYERIDNADWVTSRSIDSAGKYIVTIDFNEGNIEKMLFDDWDYMFANPS